MATYPNQPSVCSQDQPNRPCPSGDMFARPAEKETQVYATTFTERSVLSIAPRVARIEGPPLRFTAEPGDWHTSRCTGPREGTWPQQGRGEQGLTGKSAVMKGALPRPGRKHRGPGTECTEAEREGTKAGGLPTDVGQHLPSGKHKENVSRTG